MCIALFYAGVAQKINPYYNFKHLNIENGLAENIVYHFLHDSRGYMWLGTRNGITLFDGIRTINFQHNDQDKKTISGNFITRILEDSDHHVWVGTNAGIDRYDQNNNSFIHFSIPMADGKKEDTYCVLLGIVNQYDLWFIDTKEKVIKIFHTKNGKFNIAFPTDAVDGTLYVDQKSKAVNIWSYLSNGTTHYVFEKDSLRKQQHFFSGELNNVGPSMLIFHVFLQNDTAAWLSTSKGLIELNPVSRQYKIYNERNGEAVLEARFATLSPQGLLWVSTGGYGIYTFDTKTKKFIDNFRNDVLDPYSICSNNIVSLYFDKVEDVWCGSYGKGASYANVETNFFSKHLSKTELDHWKKENNIFWIGEDKLGNFWCLLQDVRGFWLLDSSLKIKDYRLPLLENGKPLNASVYQLLFDDKSSAWCATDRGLFHYDISTNRMKQVHYAQISQELFGSYWANVIIRLHDNSFLFSTFGGLYHITGKKGNESIEPFSELNNKPFKSFDVIFEDAGHNIYVKDIAENFYMLSESAPGKYYLKKTFYLQSDVLKMTEDSQQVYLATSTGLFALNKKNLTLKKSPINDRLAFSSVNDILVENNKTWIFGEKGLYFFNAAENSGRLFSTEDGLPSNAFKPLSIIYTAAGRCIAGTTNGLISFYPEKSEDILFPPRTQLINIYVNDSSKGFVPNPQEISKIILQHDQNTFSFDFSCISFQHAAACTYEYKLDHYDENWIKSGTTHYTRYSKIPPGNYTFRLRISDAKGNLSPFTKAIDIQIKKAFWQTNIFKFIMAAIFVLIIWLLIKWYLTTRIRKHQREFEKQQAIEKERTRIATDMHDDLGAGLSRIKFLSETIGMKKQLQQPVEEDISSIGGYANEMISKMGEIIWALNEKNDSLSDLLSYTRSYAVNYLLTNGIQCQVNAPAVFPSIFVSGEFRRNIYLSIKEALHNIVKYAQANKVIIQIDIGKKLDISIQDDGVGFDIKTVRPFSNGLNNMQKRMRDIGGYMEIVQKKGTIITLSAPLPT